MQDKDTISAMQESLKHLTQITDYDNFTTWSGAVTALYGIRVTIDQEIAKYKKLIATTDINKKLNKDRR